MLQVSSYNVGNYQVGYGNKASAVSKAVKSTAPQVSETAKKAVGLGALLTAVFGTKKAVETKSEPQVPLKMQYREEKVYDKSGRLTNILKYSNADDVLSLNISYDKNTGNVTQKDWYRKDGYTKQYTETYDKNGEKQRAYSYDNTGLGVRYVEEYGKNKTSPVEITYFDNKGNVESQISCDEATGDIINRFNYNEKGDLKSREEVATLTGKTTRKTTFNPNHSKLVEEYDINSGKKISEFKYNQENKLVDFNQFENEAAKRNYFSIKIDNPEDALAIKKEYSNDDFKNIAEYLENRYNMEYSE